MFLPPSKTLVTLFIAAQFVAGSVIGMSAAFSAYRSRFSARLAVRGALLGGLAFLLMSGIAGWSESHAVYHNGRRMAMAPGGEDLRLRNFLAENRLALCVASSALASLLAGIRSSKRKGKV
jgi:hypothetical protein